MFNYLKGEISNNQDGTVTVDANGVGYLVYVCGEVKSPVFVHLVVTENSHTLYGFANERERAQFRELINISGIGPKGALNILATGIDRVIAGEKVKGIGEKLRQKIVLELTGKLPVANKEVEDALIALANLGMSRQKVMTVLESLDTKDMSAEEVVRNVLQARGN